MRGTPMDEAWLEQLSVEVVRLDDDLPEALYQVIRVK